MAADLNLEWICSLPRSWTYGITRGGRVFFINEEAKSTTWLHPVTGEAVVTGHRRQSTDLPTGWEEAYTFEGARYYIKSCTWRRGRLWSVLDTERDNSLQMQVYKHPRNNSLDHLAENN
ncbi:pleckstrin homology domain-containing family A member 5 isoform X19 [Cavia porcellus]|uniref:pleckstrin homology domain-containing family A member 5 isoform X19 n=1 Tax=Cavia porcellus TaxID=10141 RepID=UPI002FE08F5B